MGNLAHATRRGHRAMSDVGFWPNVTVHHAIMMFAVKNMGSVA